MQTTKPVQTQMQSQQIAKHDPKATTLPTPNINSDSHSKYIEEASNQNIQGKNARKNKNKNKK